MNKFFEAVAENVLCPEIQLVENLSQEELDLLIIQEENCAKANKLLIEGRIDIESWIDILQHNSINVEEYLVNVDNNLVLFGLDNF